MNDLICRIVLMSIGIVTYLAPGLASAGQATPPAGRVSLEQARSAAIRSYPGKVNGEELEFEGGKWIYSFDLKKSPKDRVHEIHVDAMNGKVLDMHTETASDERKEKIEDAKENSHP